ncbi:ParB/RepB/Spo0J family partition protein [Planctomicrobium piriforme]|uniref:Chromosome partitioning protein, ParB family n=1 Tax=Planctomicrobium piriforme TaxID=1576369 RepID=A0A1I3KT40_9PLAN|nr:ParB/RepB/Spo0J family partition protein [Planctomicrobium piriforme]SFI75554.1 chromosome partitioning protein, ParB family [Planctomicrobium piriforme]
MSDTATMPPQRRLGRGLSALLGGGGPAFNESAQELNSELRQIPTAELTSNPFQPRQHFDAEALGELSASIKEHGILQPLLVREVNGGFQLIAGERRWQAAQKAGLVTVPCRVVDVVDKTACEFALEENLKRKDLSDLEKAQAFRDYIQQFECSIEELSKQLSMSRSAVSNMLRLLDLPAPVKKALNSGRISAGHARALLSLPEAEQLEMSGRIQAEQMTVRQVEAAVKKLLGRDTPVEAAPVTEAQAPQGEGQPGEQAQHQHDVGHVENHSGEHHHQGEHQQGEHHHGEQHHGHHEGQHQHGDQHPQTIPISEGESHRTHHVESLENQLRDLLGVRVEIHLNSKDSGQIVVSFGNNDEFERILGTLRRNAA